MQETPALQYFLSFVVTRSTTRDIARESRRIRKTPSHGLRVVVFGNEKIFCDRRPQGFVDDAGRRFWNGLRELDSGSAGIRRMVKRRSRRRRDGMQRSVGRPTKPSSAGSDRAMQHAAAYVACSRRQTSRGVGEAKQARHSGEQRVDGHRATCALRTLVGSAPGLHRHDA